MTIYQKEIANHSLSYTTCNYNYLIMSFRSLLFESKNLSTIGENT